MPRFFFDIDDGTHVDDCIGVVFVDMLDVRNEAMSRATSYAAKPLGLKDGWALQISVRDENKVVVMRVRMACQVDLSVD